MLSLVCVLAALVIFVSWDVHGDDDTPAPDSP